MREREREGERERERERKHSKLYPGGCSAGARVIDCALSLSPPSRIPPFPRRLSQARAHPRLSLSQRARRHAREHAERSTLGPVVRSAVGPGRSFRTAARALSLKTTPVCVVRYLSSRGSRLYIYTHTYIKRERERERESRCE